MVYVNMFTETFCIAKACLGVFNILDKLRIVLADICNWSDCVLATRTTNECLSTPICKHKSAQAYPLDGKHRLLNAA